MNFLQWFTPSKNHSHEQRTTSSELITKGQSESISTDNLNQNKTRFQGIFGDSTDFRSESVHIGDQEGLIFYLESMTDSKLIVEQVMKPLALASQQPKQIVDENDLECYRKEVFAGIGFQYAYYEHEAVWSILSGYVVLLIKHIPKLLAIKINGIEMRSISEPTTQSVVRGPKDGFTESLGTNISLIRRRVKNPNLRFESFTIGKDTCTAVNIGFIEGIANDEIVDEVRKRLSAIRTSAIIESGNIEEFLSDNKWTPFPTVYNTERPDSVAANLVEGKVVVIVDGTPFALLIPNVITDFFQVSEDYSHQFWISSFIRMIRYVAYLIAVFLPAIYVSVTTFHRNDPNRLINEFDGPARRCAVSRCIGSPDDGSYF
ncbi:spore germination protein [Paenibacillus sp. LPE1-1-1.1]